jgi:hypothetical protein
LRSGQREREADLARDGSKAERDAEKAIEAILDVVSIRAIPMLVERKGMT